MAAAKHRVLGLGEVLWDVFPEGERLGGAPANFAVQAALMGAEAFLVSCVGQDPRGELAIRQLRRRSVNTDFVSRCSQPTGTVDVTLIDGQPEYLIREDVAWDHCQWNASLDELASSVDAVCFGTLFQRSATSLQTTAKFLQATREDCLRVLAVNLRQSFFGSATIERSLGLANVLKLNDEELPVVAEIAGVDPDPESASRTLLVKYDLDLVALTCGSRGALLTSATEQDHCPALKIELSDPVGAGDVFTASVVMGLLDEHPIKTLNENANQAAAKACLWSRDS